MKVEHGVILAQDLDDQGRGYTVLRVWGSFYEMGYARAQLLGDSIVQELNLVKAYFGANYTYYRGIVARFPYPVDVADEINGIVDSLALTHPEENIDDLDVKMICDAWACRMDFGCRSHTCWGRYVAEPIKTLSTRRLDISQTHPMPRHHVLCAHVPDNGSPSWVSLDTPGFVTTWSSVNEYGTLVSGHAWFPAICNLSAGRMGQVSIRHLLTYATDYDVSTHLGTVYEEAQNNETALNHFVNYYAPEGYGGVMAYDPSMPGPDCFHLRRPNASWHHGEAMITTNVFTDGSTTSPDEDFGADNYYNNETPKTMESHWNILADHPPAGLVNFHMMSVAYRDYKAMMIWADGYIQGTTRTPRLEYEWSDLFQPPVAYFSWTPQNPDPNQPINFDASASNDPDGTIILYEWDWDNDGVYDETYSSPTATHTWASNGDYPVTLRVTDDEHVTGTITKTVNVGGTVNFTIDITGGFGVNAVITNIGTRNATNIQWTFTLTGGFVLLGKTKSGTVTSLVVGASTTAKDRPVLGFGKITIQVKVTCAEGVSMTQTRTGRVFLFFVLNM